MALFQKSVLKKNLDDLNKEVIALAYTKFRNNFADLAKQSNIKEAKEEQYQEGFLRDLFVDVLGYTLNPNTGFNLTTEYKNEKDSKKADGAVLKEGIALAVIELKGTDTVDLGHVEAQAFGYKNNQKGCRYIITSNFEKLRFYIEDSVEHLEFDLFNLDEDQFKILYLCLQKDNLLNNLPFAIKDASVNQEQDITKKLYKDYSNFKRKLYQSICALNPAFDKLIVYKRTQKLLDRFLFILFAEDKQLLPPNSIREILAQWQKLKDLDEEIPLYDRYKKYFGYMNTGYKGKLHDIFAYNGGLFAPDEVLDNILIDDTLLYESTYALSQYDFETDVDVNILGHIFEHSLNDVDAVSAELEGKQVEANKTRRKKDGVFYTPKYITKYIVENTVGKLCQEKKISLEIKDEDYSGGKKKKDKKVLNDKLEEYRKWLLSLTILDPACGSGAFLNQALEFLIAEHRKVDELRAKLFGDTFVLTDVDNLVLENNLYGVDLNEESIEIAKLSLWLRTAKHGRKLSALNNNIKCGNSLIDDPAVAGDKAFNWKEQFADVFEKGGFDVVVGNPPYGAELSEDDVQYCRTNYRTVIGHSEVYYLFLERAICELLKKSSYLGFIVPNAWLSNKYAMKVRELLLDETQIQILINFNRKIIFEDANVETAVVIIKNSKPVENSNALVGQDIGSLYSYSQSQWRNNHNRLMAFAADTSIDAVIQKVNASKHKLSDLLDVSNGFKPYQVGYGINLKGQPLDEVDVEQKIYHSKDEVDDTYKKELKGKGVRRYEIGWDASYIKWGRWLMSPKSSHYFEQPKILIRQIISDYFFAALDTEKYYADQSLYVCTNYPNQEPKHLEYFLALLNSKLYGFYFRKFYSEEDDLFPKIKVNELKNLPIKGASELEQAEFTLKTKSITSAIQTLKTLSTNFLALLQSKFALEKPNGKLQGWYELEFKAFVKELEKAKVKLSLAETAEWMSYFNEQKKKALELKGEIDKTDKEIDKMVYELYNLTPEEIKIVEGE